jgi:hypothetical protein
LREERIQLVVNYHQLVFAFPFMAAGTAIANLLGNSRKRDGKSAALSRFPAKLETISKLIRYIRILVMEEMQEKKRVCKPRFFC